MLQVLNEVNISNKFIDHSAYIFAIVKNCEMMDSVRKLLLLRSTEKATPSFNLVLIQSLGIFVLGYASWLMYGDLFSRVGRCLLYIANQVVRKRRLSDSVLHGFE